jgi:TRAP-type uncharacterized transport system substrate-binding protein
MNEKMGIKARTQPFSGSSTFVPLLNKNKIQLAMMAVGDAVAAFEGRDYFAGRPQPNIRWCQANANQSPKCWSLVPSGGKLAPFGQCR